MLPGGGLSISDENDALPRLSGKMYAPGGGGEGSGSSLMAGSTEATSEARSMGGTGEGSLSEEEGEADLGPSEREATGRTRRRRKPSRPVLRPTTGMSGPEGLLRRRGW
ncbi:hypothetical protein RTBOTA2_006823 [Rhodotorula toruloides]|nr:hypothetical protein RTBOTA2_006823 [Rhodotorula toruloides]